MVWSGRPTKHNHVAKVATIVMMTNVMGEEAVATSNPMTHEIRRTPIGFSNTANIEASTQVLGFAKYRKNHPV